LDRHQISWSIVIILCISDIRCPASFSSQDDEQLVLTKIEAALQIPPNPPGWMFYYAIPLPFRASTVWDLYYYAIEKTIGELFSFDQKE
jgi:hypothetical protein